MICDMCKALAYLIPPAILMIVGPTRDMTHTCQPLGFLFAASLESAGPCPYPEHS